MRKYLLDLGLKEDLFPENFGRKNDQRSQKWDEQREEYGFDERETWSLFYTIKLFLYERISMYNEVNIVDTSYHKYPYEGEEISFQDCIDRILEGLKLDITLDEDDKRRFEDGEVKKKIDDWGTLLILCKESLWW